MAPLSLLLSSLLLTALPSFALALAGSVPEPAVQDLTFRPLFDSDSSSWHHKEKRAWGKAWTGTTTIASAGSTGIGAMQISVVSNDEILIYDKSEGNPLQVDGHSAWGIVYTISTKAVRPLNLKTNSFCAGGGWLSNGTLVSLGGNPTQGRYAGANGLQGVRLFTPCPKTKTCDVFEDPVRVRMTSARWYPSSVRLSDGSLLILGGMVAGGYNNAPTTDNPTFEFYPPKGDGLQFYSKFLHDALNTNLFPITFALPNGLIFVAANRIAMLYNWSTNTETRLSSFPNGVRISYPASSASALLPLTIANKWTPEVLICGGTTADTEAAPYMLSSNSPASAQCVRMVLTTAGIAMGWAVEQMPEARVMGDAVLTPDGKVFIVNGAKTGIAGYGNVADEIGASNAANPNFRPTIYDPLLPVGKRFSSNFPLSKIERLYHSSATLMPDGRIWIAGSNPNDDVSTVTYATRFQVEVFSPPYITQTRPTYSGLPTNILYKKAFTLGIKVPSATKVVSVVIMDLGYSTHGVHMNLRNVELVCTRSGTIKLTCTGPATTKLYPPGYAWLYVLADGVPSKGLQVMIGDGAGPPVSAAAIKNMLAKTSTV